MASAPTQNRAQIKQVVVTAFFAAMIFLGIQSFRIPLPAAVGTPFVHFGHIFTVLAVVCLDIKGVTAAGVLGLILFDDINGYTHAIPNVLVSTILNCVLSGLVYAGLKKKAAGVSKKEYRAGVMAAAVYGVSNVVIDFVWSTCQLVIVGSSLPAALAAEVTAIPATIINSVFTVISISLLYVPVKGAFKRVLGA